MYLLLRETSFQTMFMGQIIRKILEHISYAIFLRMQCKLFV
jgi:hypothetical protein